MCETILLSVLSVIELCSISRLSLERFYSTISRSGSVRWLLSILSVVHFAELWGFDATGMKHCWVLSCLADLSSRDGVF